VGPGYACHCASRSSRSRLSGLFPVSERRQFVEDFLQSLKPTLVIPRCAWYLLLAAMQVQAVRFTDLRNFLSQFYDAFFDGILHDDRLLTQSGRADHSR
jgi:hypothetical protein